MELNLHIIVEDLREYEPQSRIEEDYDIRRLRSPALFDGSATRRDLLYVVAAAQLTFEGIEKVAAHASLLIVGEPPQQLLKRPCNLAWVEADVALARLLSEVAEIFSAYAAWGDRMRDALIAKKRLEYLGELASPLIRRPLYLVDSHLQVIFSVVDNRHYKLPEDYLPPTISDDDPASRSFVPDWLHGDASACRRPFMPPTPRSYRTLVQNIFLGERLAASLSFDEVGGVFTKRDHVLIAVLADLIGKGLTYHDGWNASIPQFLDEQIHELLDGRQPSVENLDRALKALVWLPEEAYCCIVASPLDPLCPEGLLAAAAKRVCSEASQMLYVIHDQRMVFVINVDRSTRSPEKSVELLLHRLDKLQVRVSTSTVFNHFRVLGSHYQLALAAQRIGAERTPEKPCYRFEDYFMENLIATVGLSIPLEAMIPRGLVKLRCYDEQYGTNFVPVLRTYLRHGTKNAPAARELFLHRNTLFKKIAQIKFITGLDFEGDLEVRLSTLIALYMMERL
ncbi:MAG: helix-turn-helix domain-containing protein [Coriobacteriales bacterium]|jgi:hypothetical protein|nr:helix-turn-helix domain-containing protein [Coriobacteriales bacterium]